MTKQSVIPQKGKKLANNKYLKKLDAKRWNMTDFFWGGGAVEYASWHFSFSSSQGVCVAGMRCTVATTIPFRHPFKRQLIILGGGEMMSWDADFLIASIVAVWLLKVKPILDASPSTQWGRQKKWEYWNQNVVNVVGVNALFLSSFSFSFLSRCSCGQKLSLLPLLCRASLPLRREQHCQTAFYDARKWHVPYEKKGGSSIYCFTGSDYAYFLVLTRH